MVNVAWIVLEFRVSNKVMETERREDRQADRQVDRQTDRQTKITTIPLRPEGPRGTNGNKSTNAD